MKTHKLLLGVALLAAGISVATAQNTQQQWQQNNWQQQQQSWAPPPIGLWHFSDASTSCNIGIQSNGTSSGSCKSPGKKPVGGVAMNYSWQPTSPRHGTLTETMMIPPGMNMPPEFMPPPTIYQIEWINQNRLKVAITMNGRTSWADWIRSGTSGQ